LSRLRQFRKLASTVRRDDQAAQLVEFAVALPLLVVFVVGIFDFSGAYTLKQKLTNIARDAARASASEPSSDDTYPGSDPLLPSSVDVAYQLVSQYFAANNLNLCGVTGSSYPNVVNGPTPATWILSASTTSPPCSFTLTINRGYYFPASGTAQTAPANCQANQPAQNQAQVVATCVSLQYSYQWRFGNVASLLGPMTTLPNPLTATAIAMNED
jgi:Flp pilus assembly protein TadG